MSLIKKKICLLGDVGVGKSSLIRRFVENLFDDSYLSTIGVKVSQKKISLSDSLEVLLMIWDVEGASNADDINRNYMTGASAAILVADLTRLQTIETCDGIMQSFRNVNPETAIILAGNKSDLITSKHPGYGLFKETAKKLGVAFCYTSAKNGENVEDCFKQISNMMITEK